MTTLAANSTFSGVHDFFQSGTWYAIRNIGILFLLVFWLGVAFWVFKDARRRIRDRWLVGLATLLGLVPPFLGALVYMLFRPPEYLEDVRERELEIRAMEERLSLRGSQCPVCRASIEPSFLVCPVCTTRLKQACSNCNAPLEALWQVCPHCETPVESTGIDLPVVEARPRRRRRSSSSQ
jgi:double zinc ribbon protein